MPKPGQQICKSSINVDQWRKLYKIEHKTEHHGGGGGVVVVVKEEKKEK